MPRRLLALAALLTLSALAADPKAPDPGVLPVGKDGKALNLDFETGTLKDWTATGDAFKDQPVKGDTVKPRRGDMGSRHQGKYWVGTYERQGDKPTGTLTSASFKITHPWASFLVGGGPHKNTCVELVLKDTNKVFHRASGLEAEDMLREVVDLSAHKGKEMFIRLVDNHTGHWGHVNFDDFRFHTKKPAFTSRPKPPTPDVLKYAGLKPKEAAKAMTVPEGFSVSLVAGEPDVKQPIALCLDDRGRLWVAEAYSYPIKRPEKEAKDRIVIFEDTKGTGTFDKRTVFMEGLNLVSGLEVGFGGVWIGAAPHLLFVPMKEGEDKPSGKAKILLDGWGHEDTHETLNSFLWGPDGWLYGCHGVFTHSNVGKPGTAQKDRIKINAGVWRYHPTKHVFEVFAHGTSNPWGVDFNDLGQAFVSACVIPHNWHIIQGGRYLRQAGPHFNPHTYDDIKTIAVHRHYVGGTPWAGNNVSDAVGGGHAHCGTMIYLGGSWPSGYRDQMFMGNIHGRRLNVDKLTRKGSGYVASRSPDFLKANDAWARFINMRYGPDGNVYLIDWYDKQACHHHDPKIWDRETGRIYKISYKGTKPLTVDLRKKTDKELVKLMTHQNDWYVRHARRILQERGKKPEVHKALAEIAFSHAEPRVRLRGLWALHVTGGLTAGGVEKGLKDDDENVRAWTIQLALEENKPSATLLKKFAEMAKIDKSPVVRLYLASGLQRLPTKDRWAILEGLVAHSSDAADHNLPLLYWYSLEPLATVDGSRALKLAQGSKIPLLLPFVARRIASEGTKEAISLVASALNETSDTVTRKALLSGLQLGLAGQRDLPLTEAWKKAYAGLSKSKDPEVTSRALALAVVFGDPGAFGNLRKLVVDRKASATMRRDALRVLVTAKDKELPPVLHKLVSDSLLGSEAIRGLASFDDDKTPKILLAVYAKLASQGQRDVISTLASRSAYAKALLTAVADKKVPANHLSAEIIRQLTNLRDRDIDKRIADVWGVVRSTPAARKKLIADWKKTLLTPPKAVPDVALGRALYNKVCVQCHTLFATGGKVGPELTGSNRRNLDYLLDNILDPSAVIPKEYAATLVTLKKGRVITGIVKGETKTTLTILTQTETMTIPLKDIEKREASSNSMMPDDLLKGMTEADVRALVAYLQSPVQTPVLATKDNVRDFFNGTNLTGWDGDKRYWSVDKGEIVGKSPGIGKNEFLKSHMLAEDFKLTLKMKLVPNKENSGIQFRSEVLQGGDVKGPQADAGAGWWGKLYEEHGRELLWKESGEKHVKTDDWNEYVIEARGSKVKTWINGKLCVNLDDPKLSRRGIFALQIHSGGKLEVRFKELKLEVLSPGK